MSDVSKHFTGLLTWKVGGTGLSRIHPVIVLLVILLTLRWDPQSLVVYEVIR